MSLVLHRRNGLPSLFRDVLGPDFFAPHWESRGKVAWAPSVDIYEEGDELKFEFELPGLKNDDIMVELDGGGLTGSGERKRATPEKSESAFVSRERSFGRFTRGFRLGETYDARHLTARYEYGILHVAVQKREESKSVSVEIQ